ncbi:WD40 repeat domain-containing protein [Fontivita pretiosa]|uniref:WD40 repeat domain-containing protein n=1 Tax=Fontivita pretiosa TaxID=2989684 RepID=UPI003D17AE80
MSCSFRSIHWIRRAGKLIVSLALAFTATAQAEEPLPPFRHIQKAHDGSVLCVEFSRDEKTLVSSSRDSTIKIWDLASLELKKTLRNHTRDVYSVAFNHAGNLMASGSTDTKIILWDAKTFEPIRVLEGHTAAVREVEFSPDDKTLASVGEDSTFRLWDVQTGKLLVTRTEHTKKVKSVAWYPDGKTLVTASHDLTLRLWDASGEPKQVLSGHKDVLETVDISPDGKLLFSGTGTDWGQVIFWDALTGKLLHDEPYAHGNDYGKEIDAVMFTPNGKYAVSGSKDRTIKFWDPKTYELRHVIPNNPGRIESMTFSADSRTMAIGYGGTDHTIKLWDVSKWTQD